MFDRGCTSTVQVDLCPVTSTDQWKNCAREAHRDSVTSTYFANAVIVGFLQQREIVFNQNRQWNRKRRRKTQVSILFWFFVLIKQIERLIFTAFHR